MNIKQADQIGPVSLFYLVFNGCKLHLRETKKKKINSNNNNLSRNYHEHMPAYLSKIWDLMRDTPFYETLASENSEGTANAF